MKVSIYLSKVSTARPADGNIRDPHCRHRRETKGNEAAQTSADLIGFHTAANPTDFLPLSSYVVCSARRATVVSCIDPRIVLCCVWLFV